jgi:hypothetical protein
VCTQKSAPMTAGSGNDSDRTELREELPRASDVRSGTSLIDINPVAAQIGTRRRSGIGTSRSLPRVPTKVP